MVKAYELAYRCQGEWYELAAATDVHHRFQRHSFGAVTGDALRLRVLETHGGTGGARVYEVRVRRAGDLVRPSGGGLPPSSSS